MFWKGWQELAVAQRCVLIVGLVENCFFFFSGGQGKKVSGNSVFCF